MPRKTLILLLSALPLIAEKKPIVPKELAGSTSPFSPGILADGTLYISGQIGRDPKTAEVPADFEQEMKLCLDGIGNILKAAGMKFSDAVTVTVYLTDMDLFPKMNSIYTTYFPEPRPARTTVGVTKLAAPKAHIEITVTARK